MWVSIPQLPHPINRVSRDFHNSMRVALGMRSVERVAFRLVGHRLGPPLTNE